MRARLFTRQPLASNFNRNFCSNHPTQINAEFKNSFIFDLSLISCAGYFFFGGKEYMHAKIRNLHADSELKLEKASQMRNTPRS